MPVPGPGFIASSGNVQLSAGVPKTVLGLTASGTAAPNIVELSVTFSGTTVASDPPYTVEIVYGTNVTNGAGINSTLLTPTQVRGKARTPITAAAANWTQEPTVLTSVKSWYVPGGTGMFIQSPLGREYIGDINQGTSGKFIGLRITAGAASQVRCNFEFEEN